MRYYRVVITDPDTGEVLVPNYNGQPGFSRVPSDPTLSSYTSLNANAILSQVGSTNPYAQMVELDMSVTFFHQPITNSYIKIWGAGWAERAQASNLNGLNIAIYGGMAAGLPLANPAQSGLLASGQIFQAFANSVGVEQTLEIYMFFSGSSPSAAQTTGNPSDTSTLPVPANNTTPANLVFQWSPGQPLMVPLVQCISTAFPKYNIQGAVHDDLVWVGAAATGFFANLKQLGEYLNKKSMSLISGFAPDGTYPGVSLTLQNNTVIITDATTVTTPKQIQYVDLIGQPTWGQPYHVQCTCVMRADIQCGDFVKLPLGPGITEQGSASQYFTGNISGNAYSQQVDTTAFSGTFLVTAVRHVGNNRGQGGNSWLTTLELKFQVQEPTSTVDALPVLYSSNNSYQFFLPGNTT